MASDVALRQVDVDHRLAQVSVAEQQLDGAQVGAGLEQMGGEAMAQRVRMQRLVHAAALRRPPAGVPDDLFGDRSVGGVMRAAGKQPQRRFATQTAVVLPQLIEQAGTEHDIPVPAAFALFDVEHHAGGVNVGELQSGHLRTAHAGGVQGHQDRAIEGVGAASMRRATSSGLQMTGRCTFFFG